MICAACSTALAVKLSETIPGGKNSYTTFAWNTCAQHSWGKTGPFKECLNCVGKTKPWFNNNIAEPAAIRRLVRKKKSACSSAIKEGELTTGCCIFYTTVGKSPGIRSRLSQFQFSVLFTGLHSLSTGRDYKMPAKTLSSPPGLPERDHFKMKTQWEIPSDDRQCQL